MFFAIPRMLWALRTNEIHNHSLGAAIYFSDLCLIGLDVDSEVARVETGESDCICCVCQCDGKLKFSGEVTHGVHGSTWRVWFSDYLCSRVPPRLRDFPTPHSRNTAKPALRYFPGYFVTLRETVFDFVAPFLGLTETVTLHVPAFKPLTEVPTTLQTLEEAPITRKLIFEVEATVSFA